MKKEAGKKKILIVDDLADALVEPLRISLSQRYVFTTALDTNDGMLQVQRRDIDLLVLDLHFPGDDLSPGGLTSGERMLDQLGAEGLDLPVMVISTSLLDEKKPFMKNSEKTLQPDEMFGLSEAIGKNPQWPEEFAAAMERAIENGRMRAAGNAPLHPLAPAIVGKSSAATATRKQILSAARHTAPVNLVGDIGTGKRTVAEIIHEWSRWTGGFESVRNFSLLQLKQVEDRALPNRRRPERGATLYIENAHEMPSEFQDELRGLLSRIERRRPFIPAGTDAGLRVITGFDVPMHRLVQEKKLHRDLADALGAVVIELHPLKNRLSEDIDMLYSHAVRRASEKFRRKWEETLRAETRTKLIHHPWTGNLIEFYATIERACARSNANVLLPQHIDFTGHDIGTRSEVEASSLTREEKDFCDEVIEGVAPSARYYDRIASAEFRSRRKYMFKYIIRRYLEKYNEHLAEKKLANLLGVPDDGRKLAKLMSECHVSFREERAAMSRGGKDAPHPT